VKNRPVIYTVIVGLFASLFFAIGPLTSPAHAALTCAQGGTCAVGDTGPGGGTVYYVDATGFPCGPTFSNTGSPTGGLCRYLEVAPSTWYTLDGKGLKLENIQNDSQPITGITYDPSPFDATQSLSASRIGLGYKNTLIFANLASNKGLGATTVRSYAGGSLNDWYIPTSAESNLLCQWSKGNTPTIATVGSSCGNGSVTRGGFDTTYYYYTSSAYTTGALYGDYLQNFNAGTSSTTDQFADPGVFLRPIRAFGLVSAPAFTLSKSTETAQVGTAISGYAITSTGGAVASFSISPDISATPANGVSFNTSTGLISGTPTAAAPAVTYTITGTNASGSATATYALTVNAASTSNSVQAAADAAAQVQKDKDTANVLGTLVLAIGSIQQGLAIITRAAINPGKKQVPAISAKKAKAAKVNPKPKPTTKP
jgi:hypothetical protein